MRKLLIILFCFINLSLSATEYWFSSTGNDGSAGTSIGTAWLHLNNHMPYSAGDTLYIESGHVMDSVDVYINAANTLITYYGDGDRPKILGSILITDFTNESGNIWKKYYPQSYPRGDEIYTPNGITIDYEWQECARADSVNTVDADNASTDKNTVYLDYITLTTDALIDGFAAVRCTDYQWNTIEITDNGTDYVELESDLSHTAYDLYYKRFVTLYNLKHEMDTDGEWIYRNDTLYMYSTSNPNTRNVRFAISDTVIQYGTSADNARIVGVDIGESNHIGVAALEADMLSIDSSYIYAVSGYGVRAYYVDTFKFKHSMCEDILNHGIYPQLASETNIDSNYFYNVGNTPGMANYDYDKGFGGAIKWQDQYTSGNAYIQYNIFRNVGLAIQASAPLNYVNDYFQYNYVDSFGRYLGDCGGIYYSSMPYLPGTNGHVIKNNIVYRGLNDFDSRQNNTNANKSACGVYIDEQANYAVIDSNTFHILPSAPAQLHLRNRARYYWNNSALTNQSMGDDYYSGYYVINNDFTSPTTSCDRDTVKYNNIVIKAGSNQAPYLRHATAARIALGYDNDVFYIDENKLAYPFGTDVVVGKYTYDYGSSSTNYSLSQMQTNGGDVSSIATDASTTQHMHNDFSGKGYTEEEYILVLKNYSTEPYTFDLDAANTYRDIDSSLVTTSIEVPAMYSEILFKQSGAVADTDIYIDADLVYFFTEGITGNEIPLRNNVEQQPLRNDAQVGFYRTK